MTPGLLTSSRSYKPVRYPWCLAACRRQHQIHWIGESVPLGEDVKDWSSNLSDGERAFLTHVFRFFTQSDVEVNDCYMTKYAQVFKPTEVRMMLASFSGMETIHILAYALLLETLGLPDDEFSAFLDIPAMKDKVDYMDTFGVETVDDILRTTAMFGGATEGLSLYSMFAMLMNFPRQGKMKGMGQIVSWSVRDECVDSETEVLTPKGWVRFPDLADGEEVLQYDPAIGNVSFVVPSRVVRRPYKGPMHLHQKRQFDLCCTPNHDILTMDRGKVKASEFKAHPRIHIPITGLRMDASRMSGLTPLERLRIAYAADGADIIGDNRTGERCGYQRVTLTLRKQRKINRLRVLCSEAGVTLGELSRDKFTVDMPPGVTRTLADWVDIGSVGHRWGREFIDEILQWDGHISETGDRRIYCSTNKRDIDLAQAIATMSGLSTTLTVSNDKRKSTYKTYYRLSFWDNVATPSRSDSAPEIADYAGMVYCVSVPTGCFAIRRNGVVHMTGNSLHAESIIRLHNTLVAEVGGRSPQVEDDILGVFGRQLILEDAFIDAAFEIGDVPGLTPRELKKYIRYVANWRLRQLKLPAMYLGVDEHPLPWLQVMLSGVEHQNFFEGRATEYSQAASTGRWEGKDGVWAAFADHPRNRKPTNYDPHTGGWAE